MATPENSFEAWLVKQVESQISRMIDEEYKTVEERIKRRKAEIVAGVLLDFKKEIDMQTMGQHLVITVKNQM